MNLQRRNWSRYPASAGSADDMLEDMAKQLSNAIIAEPKSWRQGDFMFYKGNNG